MLLAGCAGSGGSNESSSDTLTVCSLEPELDATLERSVMTWNTRLTEHIWSDAIPSGFASAQRTITHELGHALGIPASQHTDDNRDIMHVSHNPTRWVLTDTDIALLPKDAPTLVITDDMHDCEVAVRWGPLDGYAGWYDGETITLNEAYQWYAPKD